MVQKLERVKNRRKKPPFFALPRACTDHWNYARLSSKAVKLLVDLGAQLRGNNNGNLTVAFNVMKKRGWTSKSSLEKAWKELLETGWIVKTRQGGRNFPSLYALTFEPINECGGKLDRGSTDRPLGWWKMGYSPEDRKIRAPHKGQSTPHKGQ